MNLKTITSWSVVIYKFCWILWALIYASQLLNIDLLAYSSNDRNILLGSMALLWIGKAILLPWVILIVARWLLKKATPSAQTS